MDDFLDDETERAALKPKLKFRIGDVLYHKSDVSRTFPMTIFDYWLFDSEYDYYLEWINRKGIRECSGFKEKLLTQ